MGQKVHPVGFRLGFTQAHRSRWYAPKKLYPAFVAEDHFIRDYFYTRFPNARLVTVEISRTPDTLGVRLLVGLPTLIAGQKGEKVKALREHLGKQLKQYRLQHWTKEQRRMVDFEDLLVRVFPAGALDSHAVCLADDLAEQLEKRIPFRRAMKNIVQRAESRRVVRGVKIQVSGRLNGAEIARTEWILKGRVPLHTLDANIDYHARTAKTIYGLLGIKVWLYCGEKQKGGSPSQEGYFPND